MKIKTYIFQNYFYFFQKNLERPFSAPWKKGIFSKSRYLLLFVYYLFLNRLVVLKRTDWFFKVRRLSSSCSQLSVNTWYDPLGPVEPRQSVLAWTGRVPRNGSDSSPCSTFRAISSVRAWPGFCWLRGSLDSAGWPLTFRLAFCLFLPLSASSASWLLPFERHRSTDTKWPGELVLIR